MSAGRFGTAKAGMKLTPVMQQYVDIKRDHEDSLLFFRLGDFYEMFFEDAEKASSLLDITLTSRNRNAPNPIPMCGIPYHAARSYIARLLDAGVKVALCEQMDLPERGIARREVTRVITPGTALDEDTLAPERGNYLAQVHMDGERWGLVFAEYSTGELRTADGAGERALEDELTRVAPRELLLSEDPGDGPRSRLSMVLPHALISIRRCRTDPPAEVLERASEAEEPLRTALASLLDYLHATQAGRISHLRPAEHFDLSDSVALDEATRRNLEIVESIEGKRSGSLLAVVDRSVTAMGKRLVREWLLRPLGDAERIGKRLDAVEYFVGAYEARSDTRKILGEVGDLERLGGRIGAGSASPRDLERISRALACVDRVHEALDHDALPPLAAALLERADALPAIRRRIDERLIEDAPSGTQKGGLVRDGCHDEVDRLRAISRDGKGWMAEFEAAEKKRTGIAGLKIGYNKVFGYYLEASRAAADKIPDSYERKQTLANAERYITDELKKREAEVLGAEERLVALETHLFKELVEEVAASLGAIAATAEALAGLDALCGFAEQAHDSGYVRPELAADGVLEIEEGRHPVVERAIGNRFIPNDCRLGPDQTSLMVITGPNMAGKSTYLRQVALLALLAHCGSFVPATRARIPLVDRIFTRIGASDNLVRGQSTFMVEMSETANILANMTQRSLVVLDEIGRGTSTFDGISIAWAVAEEMVRRRVKTLFATHYHELATLAEEHGAVANFSVAVRRYKGEIVFLYRVAEGAASGSFGIEVARLAGLPESVIEDARRLLERFESGESPVASAGTAGIPQQPNLFDLPARTAPLPAAEGERQDPILQALREVKVEETTPVEALVLLERLVRDVRNRQ